VCVCVCVCVRAHTSACVRAHTSACVCVSTIGVDGAKILLELKWGFYGSEILKVCKFTVRIEDMVGSTYCSAIWLCCNRFIDSKFGS
jgi:hypothetical protein